MTKARPIIAENTDPCGCWLMTYKQYAGRIYSFCGYKARPDHLTCRYHAHWEGAAQRIKSDLTILRKRGFSPCGDKPS